MPVVLFSAGSHFFECLFLAWQPEKSNLTFTPAEGGTGLPLLGRTLCIHCMGAQHTNLCAHRGSAQILGALRAPVCRYSGICAEPILILPLIGWHQCHNPAPHSCIHSVSRDEDEERACTSPCLSVCQKASPLELPGDLTFSFYP